jgi:sugar phosphate permease
MANYFDRTVISFAGPSIMKSMSLEPRAFGLVLSSFGLGYTLAQIPGGLVADRWGSKAPLVIAPLLWALFTGLTGLAVSLAAFMAVRLCLGLSEGGANAATLKVQGDHFASKERALAAGIWATSFAIAPAIAGPSVGILLTSYSWRWAFLVMMIPALLAALINVFIIPARGAPRDDAPPSRRSKSNPAAITDASDASLRSIIGRRSLWWASLTWFCFNIAYWGFLGWMPSYLALERHIDVKAAGLLGGVPYVFGVAGLVVIGWLGSNRLYRYRPALIATSYLLGGAALYVAYSSSTLASSVIGLSGAAFFVFGSMSPFAAIALDLAPQPSRATYWAVVSTVGQVSGIVAPALIGGLVSATGTFASGFAFMAGALCCAAVCVLSLRNSLSAATESGSPAGPGARIEAS